MLCNCHETWSELTIGKKRNPGNDVAWFWDAFKDLPFCEMYRRRRYLRFCMRPENEDKYA
jgi:hypothetical protein